MNYQLLLILLIVIVVVYSMNKNEHFANSTPKKTITPTQIPTLPILQNQLKFDPSNTVLLPSAGDMKLDTTNMVFLPTADDINNIKKNIRKMIEDINKMKYEKMLTGNVRIKDMELDPNDVYKMLNEVNYSLNNASQKLNRLKMFW